MPKRRLHCLSTLSLLLSRPEKMVRYYASEKKNEKGAIPIREIVKVVLPPPSVEREHRRNLFYVEVVGRSYWFEAPDPDALLLWTASFSVITDPLVEHLKK